MSWFNYCSNPTCPNHRGLAGWSTRSHEGAAPANCPLCHAEIIWTDSGHRVFTIPETMIEGDPTATTTVGIVIDTVPYGGHALRLGDDDTTHKFGGTVRVGDANQYVAELKYDLTLLGYYSPSRFQDLEQATPGGFHIHLLAAVVALKYDLIHEYGVTAAVAPPPPSSTEDLSPASAGPIQFDTHIASPYDEDFAALYQSIVGEQPHRVGLCEKFETAQDKWSGRRGWYTTAEAARATSTAARPVLQAVVQPRLIQPLVDTRARHQGDLSEVLDTLAQSSLLTVVPGEPDTPALGEPLDVNGGEGVRFLDAEMTRMLSICDTVVTAVNAWDTGTAGQAGSLRAEIERLAALETAGTTLTGTQRSALRTYRANLRSFEEYRDAWRLVRQRTRVLVARIRAMVRTRMPQLIAYHNKLISCGSVDMATGIYIKHMLLNRTLPSGSGERGVFVCPTGDDIEEIPAGETAVDVIISVCATRNVPSPFMLDTIHHESGSRQSRRLGSTRVPIYGVDWNNQGHKRHFFDEVQTLTSPWRSSCGWGLSQYTTFSRPVDGMTYRTGIPTTRTAELVVPAFVASARGNVDVGVSLMRDKFEDYSVLTGGPRDCTFATRFACPACLARLGCTTAASFASVFEPLNTLDEAATYRLALAPARMVELFGGAEADYTPQGRREWPCSWLMAKIRYTGTGSQAWQAMRSTVLNLTALASPPPAPEATAGTTPSAP